MLSTSFTMSGEMPNMPNMPNIHKEVKTDSDMNYSRPRYPQSSGTSLRLERDSPTGLFINEFIDKYEDAGAFNYLTTSTQSRRKDLQPRIILESPMLTSTPRDSAGQRVGRGDFYPPSDTLSGRGHFDQPSDTIMPPLSSRYRLDSTKNYKRNPSAIKVLPTKENSNISRIQSRPLPLPSSSANENNDHVYLSPIKLKQKQAARHLSSKQQPALPPQTQLHISPPQKSPPAPSVTRMNAKAPEPQAKGLGRRAVTEMDFTRAYVSGQLARYEKVSTVKDSGHLASEPVGDSLVRKGLMWVQQDKLFSRWKERFIILTTGYLQIFKKGTSRISDMGPFVSKIRLSQVGTISLEDRRGYLTLFLTTQRDGKILLRKPEGIKEWYNSIVHHSHLEKQTTRMKTTEQFWKTRQATESQDTQDWLLARERVSSVSTVRKFSEVSVPRRRLSPHKHSQDKFKLSPDKSSTSYFLPSSRSDMFGREDSGFESLATTSLESEAASFKHTLHY